MKLFVVEIQTMDYMLFEVRRSSYNRNEVRILNIKFLTLEFTFRRLKKLT